MIFAHDTEVALAAAAALVNTAGRDEERMPDLAALDKFFETYGWTGKRDSTPSSVGTTRTPRTAASSSSAARTFCKRSPRTSRLSIAIRWSCTGRRDRGKPP